MIAIHPLHSKPDGYLRGSPLVSHYPFFPPCVMNLGWKGWAQRFSPWRNSLNGVAWLIPYCARPASTARSDRHLKLILVRDARARGISLAAPPPSLRQPSLSRSPLLTHLPL